MGRGRWFCALVLSLFCTARAAHAESLGEALVDAALQGALNGLFNAWVGAALPQPPAGPPALDVGDELADWAEPGTGSTRRSAQACGLVLDGALSGTRQRNFLSLTVRKDTSDVPLVTRSFFARFGSGKRVQLVIARQSLREPGRLVLAFASKAAFEGEDRLELSVTLARRESEGCELSLRFSRPPATRALESSYRSYTAYELTVAMGAPLIALGPFRQIAQTPNVEFELGLGLYPTLHHGITLDVLVNDFGRSGAQRVLPSAVKNAALLSWGILPGYAFRTFVGSRWILSSGVNAGAYQFDLGGPQPGDPRLVHWAFALRAEQSLSYVAKSWLEFSGRVAQTSVFAGDFGQAPASGELFSALLGMTIAE